ncbi:MAG: hypothetical protein L6R35_006822 [Caloplaca aegaea]|nr:MAG: hypothetical protein L6R35_006822 [Caloplaca aegaea]
MSLALQSVANYGGPYSVQDAFFSFENGFHDAQNQSSPLLLLSEGCTLDSGTKNCSLACEHAGLIFGDTATLHNCLQYPIIAGALSRGTLDSESVEIATQYGIYAGDVDPSITITETIQQCLNEYCDSTSRCGRPKTSNRDADGPAKICAGQLCYNHTDICEGVYAPVIDDIAGIGIYTSYWMQNGIALVAFALLRLFDFWIYYVTLALFGFISGRGKARARAENARQLSLRYRLPNLISALFEFQKAQCFFMMAVQVAAIIIVRGGGFESKNLQQLSNSYSAITLVAICGYLPVVFTLVNLHGAGKNSWYILLLSTVTVAISGGTAFNTRRFEPSPNDMASLRKITGSWRSCGNKNPTTFCLSRRTVDPFGYGGGALHIFIFCLIILTFLTIDKARTSRMLAVAGDKFQTYRSLRTDSLKPSKGRTLTQLTALSRVSTIAVQYNNLDDKRKRVLSNVLYGSVWIIFLVLYCRWIYLLSTWINTQSGVIGPSNWSFGQIVGITVWVPSLIQYIYLETRNLHIVEYNDEDPIP